MTGPQMPDASQDGPQMPDTSQGAVPPPWMSLTPESYQKLVEVGARALDALEDPGIAERTVRQVLAIAEGQIGQQLDLDQLLDLAAGVRRVLIALLVIAKERPARPRRWNAAAAAALFDGEENTAIRRTFFDAVLSVSPRRERRSRRPAPDKL